MCAVVQVASCMCKKNAGGATELGILPHFLLRIKQFVALGKCRDCTSIVVKLRAVIGTNLRL